MKAHTRTSVSSWIQYCKASCKRGGLDVECVAYGDSGSVQASVHGTRAARCDHAHICHCVHEIQSRGLFVASW
jgi:hypothetical protein